MDIRYVDAVREFEEIELKFHIRNIFASNKIGAVKEVKICLEEPDVNKLFRASRPTVQQLKQSEWLIEIPPRRTGEFVCSRLR